MVISVVAFGCCLGCGGTLGSSGHGEAAVVNLLWAAAQAVATVAAVVADAAAAHSQLLSRNHQAAEPLLRRWLRTSPQTRALERELAVWQVTLSDILESPVSWAAQLWAAH